MLAGRLHMGGGTFGRFCALPCVSVFSVAYAGVQTRTVPECGANCTGTRPF